MINVCLVHAEEMQYKLISTNCIKKSGISIMWSQTKQALVFYCIFFPYFKVQMEPYSPEEKDECLMWMSNNKIYLQEESIGLTVVSFRASGYLNK